MSFIHRCLFPLTSVLALAASACSANPARLARSSETPVTCLGGVIRTNEEAARYCGCTAVTGDVRIMNSHLSDLTAFESLRSVSGALIVANNAELSDFSGLEALASVASLDVQGNASLSSFRGLSGLRSAAVVKVRHNPELASVEGLEGLSQIDKLDISDNGLFETSGLANLREVGELTIADNARLISLHGLNGLTRARSLRIRNNRVLCAQLGLLPQLGEVSETLDLSSNRSLSRRELDGLRDHVKLQLAQRPTDAVRQAALR